MVKKRPFEHPHELIRKRHFLHPQEMDKPKSPIIVWFGGINTKQDVSIRLVPNGLNHHQGTTLRNREPLAVLKVHSSRLEKHSKYFQACLSTRWTDPDSPPSTECNLELTHGLQVASYRDCFSRMYKPSRKDFKDVASSLELLRVASQIEFLELVDSISRYLSTILWSEQDEIRIRQFSSSPDFPRSQAEDLVARLQIGEHDNKEHRTELLCQQIAHSIRIALRQDGSGEGESFGHRESFRGARSLFEDLFSSIRHSKIDSAFENDMVTIVIREVKEMLESFHEDCRKHAEFYDLEGETTVEINIGSVFDFKRKLKALCWALELLLKTQVAEEVIECWLHLELFFSIILEARAMGLFRPTSENVALQFCKLVILIFQEVVAGRLLLGIPDRVLLIEDWQWMDRIPNLDTQRGILKTWGFEEALEGVFLTLPLKQKLEALQQNSFFSHAFISKSSLVTQMKRNWPAEAEVEGGVSDSTET